MSNLPELLNTPGVAEVKQILEIKDPVIRNLRITQCYHKLSTAFAGRVGLCANWCTFATWASKQAGQTIRRKDLSATFDNLLDSGPATSHALERVVAAVRKIGANHKAERIRKAALDALGPASPVNRASDAVARGNKKVFEEIGHEFARFFEECLHDEVFDQDKIARFCERLHAGEPPEGQDCLRRAFTLYYRSLFESDPKARAELLLLANIEIGFHEQTRLQPEIEESLNALVPDPEEFKSRLLDILLPNRGWFSRLRHFFMWLFRVRSPLDEAAHALVKAARDHARLAVTEHLMTISLPRDVRLRLGEDLNARFPATLMELSNPDLVALLARLDPTPNSVRESGAVDWANLPERLHYIIDLFRCYQETGDLFEPPFTPAQVAELMAGRMPGGRL